MKTRRSYKKRYCSLLVPVLCAAVLFADKSHAGALETMSSLGSAYESLLFDTSLVHSIEIEMDDWQGFLENCTDKTYVSCKVTVDGEAYDHVAIRAKGNTSLSKVAAYGNDRYSFKVEFDHYNDACRYHGLDKLSLNNIIQDNTYMKDYLTYEMMRYCGVAAPLCSFAYITVNGEDWGLYLAVEGVEDAFLSRCYETNTGSLYKPDSMKMGGGRGNGGDFRMEDWNGEAADEMPPRLSPDEAGTDSGGPEGMPEGFGGPGGMGSDDVSLIYTDDDYESYENIFTNAKTDLTDADTTRLIAALKDLNAKENIEDTVDADQVIRYFVVHNFVCNFDSYTGSMIHNYYLYEEDGRLSMIPWDYNLAFGGFESSMDAGTLVNYPIDSPVRGGSADSRPMLAWIFDSEDYTSRYHQVFSEFIASFFESGYFEKTIADTYSLIAPYVEKDPTKFCTFEEFETGAATLQSFCLLRARSVRGQLDGSIPSDSAGQAADTSALIDASSLKISDMGTMEPSR